MDLILSHLTEIGTFIGGLVTGAIGGSLITMRYTRNSVGKNGGTLVNQKNAKAGRDVIGRDKNG